MDEVLSFFSFLSETVSGQFPAVVNCSVVGANNGPQFRFEPTIVDVGRRTAQVRHMIYFLHIQTHHSQLLKTNNTSAATLWEN